MGKFADAPEELKTAIAEFWPKDEWDNAAAVAELESGWNAFAVADTRRPDAPCGTSIGQVRGVPVSAELSVGWFQINACGFPGWEWQRLYNTRHNAGTAHLLWETAGESWRPWFFSAQSLGLL